MHLYLQLLDMTTAINTTQQISTEEASYREEQKNALLASLQVRLGKSREQLLALFRFYNTQKPETVTNL